MRPVRNPSELSGINTRTVLHLSTDLILEELRATSGMQTDKSRNYNAVSSIKKTIQNLAGALIIGINVFDNQGDQPCNAFISIYLPTDIISRNWYVTIQSTSPCIKCTKYINIFRLQVCFSVKSSIFFLER